MRALLAALLLLPLACTATAQVPQALSRAQVIAILKQVQALAKELQADLDAANADKAVLETQLVTVQQELTGAKDETARLQTDITKLRDWGVSQQERADKAELDAAKKQAAILRRDILIGLMTLAIGAYLFLRFYLRLPI